MYIIYIFLYLRTSEIIDMHIQILYNYIFSMFQNKWHQKQLKGSSKQKVTKNTFRSCDSVISISSLDLTKISSILSNSRDLNFV